MVIPVGTNVLVRGTSRDVIHSFWIPRLNGKRDMVPGRVQTLRIQADEPGIYAGQCTEFCGLSHANMRMEVVALDPDDFETWKAAPARAPYEAPEEGTLAADGRADVHRPVLAVPPGRRARGRRRQPGHRPARAVRVLRGGAQPDPPDDPQHVRRRHVQPARSSRATTGSGTPRRRSSAQLYLEGVTPECLNQVDLREWLRNAPAKKPMYTEPTELGPTDGKTRGMPYLALSEDQIDEIIAYLLERH